MLLIHLNNGSALCRLLFFSSPCRRNEEIAQQPEIKHLLALLDACLAFDVKKAADLLGLTIPRKKTFGYHMK